MYGFIVTTHYENYTIIKKCLDLLIQNIPENSFIILYVNETKCDKVLNIKNEYLKKNFNKLETIYINNQKLNNGLTGTWNQGIDYLLNKKDFECKVITILGHDTYINKDIIHLLESAKEAQDSLQLKYFGPLYKYFPGKKEELHQVEGFYKMYNNINSIQDNTITASKWLVGALFTFPINSLKKLKEKYGYYFDIKFPFGYNDIDVFNRFKNIGGTGKIITNCIIDHEYKRTWVPHNNSRRTVGTNVSNGTNFVQTKIEDLKFNWKDYIKKNPDLRTIGTEQKAINHYLTKGQYQGRKY